MKNSMLWLCRCGEESDAGTPHPSVLFRHSTNWPMKRPAKLSQGLAHSRRKEAHMKLAVTYGDALTHERPLLVLGVWDGESLPRAVAGLLEEGDWNGTFKQTTLLYPRGEIPAR